MAPAVVTPGEDHTLEFEPRQVRRGRRPWLGVIAVFVASLSIVAAAALAGGPSSRSTGQGSTVARAASAPAAGFSSPTDRAERGEPGALAGTSRPMPTSIACHAIDRFACRLAVATALGTLEGELPSVESADVWSSLICGDTLDCPATHLDGRATPLAGVIFRLVGGGPAAWINVVYRSPGPPLEHNPTLDAWIARWQEAP